MRNQQSHRISILITLAILTLLPLTASAENFTDFTFVAIGAMSLGLIVFAFIGCLVVHKKTGNALSWLLFPLWLYVGYSAIIVISYLVSTIISMLHHSTP